MKLKAVAILPLPSFFNQSSDTSININGSTSNSYGIMNIHVNNNSFSKGTALKITTTTVPVLVYNNMFTRGQLGTIPNNGVNIDEPNFFRN